MSRVAATRREGLSVAAQPRTRDRDATGA